MRRRSRLPALALALGGLLASTACATLPTSGPVQRLEAPAAGVQPDAPYFNPPGPAEDGTPAAIASGFLVAMRANPLTLTVAREFLTQRARSAWKPSRGTILYEAFGVDADDPRAQVRLTEPRRLDARGGWEGGPSETSELLDLRLVRENGQWRVDEPPDALVVPTTYFERNFSRLDLYFYDRTGRVLLPDPVFLPRGEQTATSLVRGLLAGPGGTLRDVARSAFPRRTSLDLPVVVTRAGVAEVPLSREVLQGSTDQLVRAADQLAWTLRQVPAIARVRMTVGGTPVPLPGGTTDVPVSSGEDLDAAQPSGGLQLWGLRSGRVVDLESGSGAPAPGPLGQPGYGLRSLAVSELPRQVAGVGGDGSTVLTAPADGRGQARAAAVRVVRRGTDLLRPAYDMFGQLWLVDRTSDGARVLVVRGRQVRELRVPGVTGADVAAFAPARDGSRVAFALEGEPAPSLRVVDVLRAADGRIERIGRSRAVSVGSPVGGPDNGAEGARLADLGWRDPTTLAVLARTGADSGQVVYVSADGSPASTSLVEPSVLGGDPTALVVAPDGDLPMRLVTSAQRLYTLTRTGQWPRTESKVAAATYGS